MKPLDRLPVWFSLVWLSMTASLPTTIWAVEAIVITTEGYTFEGSVVSEDRDTVILMISDVKTPILRSKIRSIQYKQSIEEQYTQRRSQLSEEDIDGRYILAYWLFEKKAYPIALKELENLLITFPDDTRITRLKKIVEDKYAQIQANKTIPSTQPNPDPKDNNSHKNHPLRSSFSRALTDEQINLIKVYEIDLSTKPKIVIPRHVLDDFLSAYGAYPDVPKTRRSRNKFLKAPGYEQLQLFFQLKARNLYAKVKVIEDPLFMRDFRAKIHHRYVLNYCGTSQCHGGLSEQSVSLIRAEPNSTRTVYTNFFNLQSTTVGHADMIDRQQANRSMLLQFGLPKDLAMSPHPNVPDWRPKFRNQNDGLYLTIERWIDTLWKPAPDYGINPTVNPIPVPATQPSP